MEYELTDDDRKAIAQLRENVKPLLQACEKIGNPYDTDLNLYRWLLGYHFDQVTASARLSRHLKLRRLLCLGFERHRLETKTLREFTPLALIGPTGRDSTFLVGDSYGRYDIKGLLRSTAPWDFLMYQFDVFERCMTLMNQLEAKTGRCAGIVVVADLDGLHLEPALLQFLRGGLRVGFAIIGNHYPEMLHRKIVLIASASEQTWRAVALKCLHRISHILPYLVSKHRAEKALLNETLAQLHATSLSRNTSSERFWRRQT